ncbi:MAG: 5-formyltetrahydrofolate cyclo-ligase [Eubacterium sp.]|nr:5-formyltetrahydrofolate cyclo-ligase [Eubacterium sp.]
MQKLTKKELRRIYIQKRRETEDKEHRDERIFANLISLDVYKTSDVLLCYASKDGEVKTDGIIEYSLSVGKRVALPYCKDKKGNMDFYFIKALDELTLGYYDIRQPDINTSEKVSDFENALLVVPALCYRADGFRLGYGGGYYDRFIEKYGVRCVGLCYESLITEEIPVEEYDRRVDYIVTENGIIRV